SVALTVAATTRMGGATPALVIPWTRAAATVLTVVPAAFLFAALMVAVGALGELPLAGATLVAPGMNLTLLARDLMVAAATPGHAAVVLASTLAYGALALGLAARLYDSERFLASSDGQQLP